MDRVRQELIENEKRLKALFDSMNVDYSSSRIDAFNGLRKDGNLIGYVNATSKGDNFSYYASIAHEHGYKTCLDLIADYMDELQAEDALTVRDLILNEEYSSYEIAALGGKYSIQRGMAFFLDSGTEYITIKSQPSGKKHNYKDGWIEEGKLYQYSIQKETHGNLETYSFANKPNRKIFDSIISQEGDPLRILLFIKEKNRDGFFAYRGEFKAINFEKDKEAFILGTTLMEDEDPTLVHERDDFFTAFIETNKDSILSGKKALKVVRKPSHPEKLRQPNETVSGTTIDYVKQAIANEKIGKLGEEAVFIYEKEKIRKSLPDRPEYAEQLIKEIKWVSQEPGGAKYGYDIQSFNIENGEAVPIFIEVKTTTGGKDQAFFLTQHELETAHSEAINRNYYIYRVFEINAEEPGMYLVRGNPENFFQLTPHIWLAKVK